MTLLPLYALNIAHGLSALCQVGYGFSWGAYMLWQGASVTLSQEGEGLKTQLGCSSSRKRNSTRWLVRIPIMSRIQGGLRVNKHTRCDHIFNFSLRMTVAVTLHVRIEMFSCFGWLQLVLKCGRGAGAAADGWRVLVTHLIGGKNRDL